MSGAHHGSLLHAVTRLDDIVVLSRPAQEVRQLAVGTLHGLTLSSICTISSFVLGGGGGGVEGHKIL